MSTKPKTRKRSPSTGHPRKADNSEFQRRAADFLTGGIGTNTLTVRDWSDWLSPGRDIDFGTFHQSMLAAVEGVKKGDLTDAEAMLMAQAVSMNAIFVNLTRRAHTTEYVEQMERYIRLALKAQGQCRATIETLAMMKNPPLFAKQANITAGPQQVNNSFVTDGFARAEIQESAPNKVLGAHDQRLDERPTIEAADRNPPLEAVGALDGPTVTGREAASIPERLPRR